MYWSNCCCRYWNSLRSVSPTQPHSSHPSDSANDCLSGSFLPFLPFTTLSLCVQNVSVPEILLITSCLCHDTNVQCSAVGHSLLLVRWPGTCCQTIRKTWHVLPTKLFCSYLTQCITGIVIMCRIDLQLTVTMT